MKRAVLFALMALLSLGKDTKRYSLTVQGRAPRSEFSPTTAVVRVLTAQEISPARK